MLRPITCDDIEKLRVWRNAHINKKAFFHNEFISKEEQSIWFRNYLTRKDDWMYIIEYHSFPIIIDIGCIGYRPFGEYIEIYNVILGNKEYARNGLMGKAFYSICEIIKKKYDKDIVVRMIKGNKAVYDFYIKRGCRIIKELDDSFIFKVC